MNTRKLDGNEKIELLKHWYRWFHDHTDWYSWITGLAPEIVYLFGAIVNDGVVHTNPKSKLRQTLRENKIPANDPIWGYIHLCDKIN